MIELSHAQPPSHHISVRLAVLLSYLYEGSRHVYSDITHHSIHSPRPQTTYIMVTTVRTAHTTEAATRNGVYSQPLPRARVGCSAICLHTTQSPTLLAFLDENSLCTKGRVSGYWNQRQSVWSFGVGGTVSGHLESAP